MDDSQLINKALLKLDSKFVEPKPIQIYNYNKHFCEFSETILRGIREKDPCLKLLNSECSLQGSAGDKLKVGKPDEYDMVFFLNIPYSENIKVLPDIELPGNVHLDITRVLYNLRLSEKSEYIYKRLSSLIDDKNQIIVQKLQNWIKSIVTRVLNEMNHRFEYNGNVCQLKYKNCGPAHTIYINGDYNYSVDFVPAIPLSAEKNILEPNELIYFKNQTHWEAIPKPLKPHRANSTSFRCSYYNAERDILGNKDICKTAIKLMKKFRDVKTNLSLFKSYYFKILFLWKIAKNSDTNWHCQSLTVILTDVFEDLENCLRLGNLPFFWHPKLNMLSILKKTQINEMFKVVEGTTKLLHELAQRETAANFIWRDLLFSFTTTQERIEHLKIEKESIELGEPYHNSQNIDDSQSFSIYAQLMTPMQTYSQMRLR